MKNKASVLVTTIIIIVVLAVVGGAAWYVVSKKQPSPSPGTGEEDQFKNWKTYRNDVFDFSLKYPPQYTIEDNLPKTKALSSGSREGLHISNNSDQQKPRLSLYVNPAGWGPYFADITYEISEKDNGIQINKREIQPVSENNQDGNILIFIRTTRLGEHSYFFTFTFKENGQDYESIFNQILSTFKFIDETADWKTYRNEEYGFEFKYPVDWKIDKTSLKGTSFIKETGVAIPKTISFSVNIYDNKSSISLEDYYTKGLNISKECVESSKTLTINNYKVIKILDKCGYSAITNFLIAKNQKVFILGSMYTAPLEEMMNTFKFTK